MVEGSNSRANRKKSNILIMELKKFELISIKFLISKLYEVISWHIINYHFPLK